MQDERETDDEKTLRTLSNELSGWGGGGLKSLRAAEALAKIGSPKAIKALCSQLGSYGDDDYLKFCVCHTLVRIGPPAVEGLCLMLNHDNLTGRILAANLLGKIRDARAVEPLRKRLRRINNPAHRFVSCFLERIDYGHGVHKTTWHAETDALLDALAKW
jgi:HEAT repeat protein